MAETWISEAELDAVFGEDEITRAADLDRDGARDPGVVVRAIVSVEGRIRSRLMTRFRPEELPTPANVSEALRRVALGLTFYELEKHFEQVSPSVVRVRDDAMAELDDLVDGKGALGLVGHPPADTTRPLILTSPSREDRLTLKKFDL